MAWITYTPGLSEPRRWLRGSHLKLRRYCDRTQAFAVRASSGPLTLHQEAARGVMGAASGAWHGLPDHARAAWGAYAKKHGGLISEQLYKNVSNWGVYLPAFRNRQLLGLPPVEVPLEAAPPEPVTAVEEVASSDVRTFTFRVHHRLNPAGHVVLARLTGAMTSVTRKPTPHVARIICGHDGSSLAPLPPTGGTVAFTNARFAIREGERYGVELRIVRRADGIHSRPFFADLIRKGPEEQRRGAKPCGNAMQEVQGPVAIAVRTGAPHAQERIVVEIFPRSQALHTDPDLRRKPFRSTWWSARPTCLPFEPQPSKGSPSPRSFRGLRAFRA